MKFPAPGNSETAETGEVSKLDFCQSVQLRNPASPFSEKILKAHQLHVFRRQDQDDHIGLWRGVNFVEMPLRFAKLCMNYSMHSSMP